MPEEMKKTNEILWADNIRQRLEKLPLKKQLRLVWHCAVQTLPFLSVVSNREPFFYWGKKRQAYLLAVFRALDTSAVAAFSTPTTVAATIAAAAHDAARIINDAGGDAVYAVYAAAALAAKAADAALETQSAATRGVASVVTEEYIAAYTVAAINTTMAANETSDASMTRHGLLSLIEANLQILEEGIDKALYMVSSPHFDRLLQHFFADLRRVKCSYWADWYKHLFYDGILLDSNRIEEIGTRLIASSSNNSAMSLARYMKNRNNGNDLNQTSSVRAKENTWESANHERSNPESIDLFNLKITESDLDKLCEARYTVVAGENGCGKTRLLKAIKNYLSLEKPDAVVIFADFANAYFTLKSSKTAQYCTGSLRNKNIIRCIGSKKDVYWEIVHNGEYE